MKEFLLKTRYFDRRLSKTLKKSTLFFLPNQVPFNVQSYQQQKRPGTSDLLLLRLQKKKLRAIPLLVIYYLTKFNDVLESSCWVILKITFANLCKPIHDINYSTSICPLVFGKYGKEVEKLQKIEYLENEKSFLDEIKNTLFIVFEGLSFDEKNKNLIKNSTYKL